MSEYWVSKKKYFCKYCDIYINDDAPSRQQHESGLRHKGNKERFVRNLYKTSEKKKKDMEEEKRDMARIEQAAQAAFSQDVGAGRAKATSTPGASSSSASSSKKPLAKPSNPYANYSTAASLGYTDPDIERMNVETERRRTEGMAGDWQIVAPPVIGTSGEGLEVDDNLEGEEDKDVKREAIALAEPVVDEEDTRTFKLKKRTVGVGLGEIYDPGLIPIKVKKRKVDEEEGVKEEAKEEGKEEEKKVEGLKWTAIKWRKAGDPIPAEEAKVKEEEQPSIPESIVEREEVKPEVKEEDSVLTIPPQEEKPPIPAPAPTNLFKKRKAPGSVASRR